MIRRFSKTAISPSQGHFALLVLRVGAGVCMLTHGVPKLTRLMDGNLGFVDPFGLGEPATLMLAILAEVICAVLVILGLSTRLAAIPLAVTMFVAAFVVHSADPFNVREIALLYLFIFIALIFLGSGKFSLDRAILKK